METPGNMAEYALKKIKDPISDVFFDEEFDGDLEFDLGRKPAKRQTELQDLNFFLFSIIVMTCLIVISFAL